jgi:hypothetical protein
MLKQKRREIIDYVKAHKEFLEHNHKTLDIYQGNLLKYVSECMRSSLSPVYYNAIKDRILPINILQRYTDKVSTAYAKPPMRFSDSAQDYVDYYAEALDLDVSGGIADTYSTLFKGFAWEPFIDNRGRPALRELSFDSFIVMSDSASNPEEETIFIKLMGQSGPDEDSLLLHVYTDAEFDAFYLNGQTDLASLDGNDGINLFGTIPFVYGKRQKNKLIPVTDSDLLAMAKAIPIMLSDAAGAQMFQAFSIIWAIDVDIKDLKMSPNAIWDIKSDKTANHAPQVGTVKPEADTDKVVAFVVNMFVMWLETKGVRVGSIGSIDAGNAASGISKIIDEMDVSYLKAKSQQWFERDESELWNRVLPKMHQYWLKTGAISGPGLPAVPDEPEVVIAFERPEPMLSRAEEIANTERELAMGTMTLDQAIRKLHPKMTDEEVAMVVAQRIPV